MAELSREEKENLYIQKVTELEIRKRNPVPLDDGLKDEVGRLSDAHLNAAIAETVGQLRFEKIWGGVVYVVAGAVLFFVAIGVIGLLLFGWRQLLQW